MSDIDIGQTVDIFLRIDAVDDALAVQMTRQRHHRQDAENGFIFIELVDERKQFYFAYFCRFAVDFRFQADSAGCLLHRFGIHRRRCIVTDEDDGQLRLDMQFFLNICQAPFYPLAMECGDFFTVK